MLTSPLDRFQSSIMRASYSNASGRTHPARDSILLLNFLSFQSIPPNDMPNWRDSCSPKRAHRLAHRRSDNIHHPLRGLEAATSGDLGDGTGESCAAEGGSHAEGHCVVCVVGESTLR